MTPATDPATPEEMTTMNEQTKTQTDSEPTVTISRTDLMKVQDAIVAADVRISDDKRVTKASLAAAYDIVQAALAPEGGPDAAS